MFNNNKIRYLLSVLVFTLVGCSSSGKNTSNQNVDMGVAQQITVDFQMVDNNLFCPTGVSIDTATDNCTRFFGKGRGPCGPDNQCTCVKANNEIEWITANNRVFNIEIISTEVIPFESGTQCQLNVNAERKWCVVKPSYIDITYKIRAPECDAYDPRIIVVTY